MTDFAMDGRPPYAFTPTVPGHPSQSPGAPLLPLSTSGDGMRLFAVAFVNMLLVLATLGIYRFWWRARLRRWLWSSIRIGNDSLVYTGSGWEMFRGFLIAVCILAVLLLMVQLGLTFLGMSFFNGHPAALQLSILGVAPFLAYAQYKGRAYVLSRTAWRGIRFGMDRGVAGYILRFVMFWLITILTLGLLLPLQQFQLERYLVDRTYFGDRRFRQTGTWLGLMRPWLLVWALMIVPAVLFALSFLPAAAAAIGPAGVTALQMIVPPIWVFGIFVAPFLYSARSFSYLHSHKTIGAGVQLQAGLSARSIIAVYLRYLAILGLVSVALAVIVLTLLSAALPDIADLRSALHELRATGRLDDLRIGALTGSSTMPFLAIPLLVAVLIAAFSALTTATYTLPMLRRSVRAITICYPAELFHATQRMREARSQADGFADALDVDLGL